MSNTSVNSGKLSPILGTFQCSGSKMIVCDPCYQRGCGMSALFENAKPGNWSVCITKDPADGSVAELIVFHSECYARECVKQIKWKQHSSIGVDTGQAGFYDEAMYPNGDATGEHDDLDSFYGQACQQSSSVNGAGILKMNEKKIGAVSMSGWGDGAYPLYVSTKGGHIVAAKIDYLLLGEAE